MAIRKNANDLTAAERLELVTALKTLKTNGRYNLYVMRHAQAPMTAIHQGPAFLPWHRAFILDLEKELQQVSGNNDLGLPYWNWPEGDGSASIWDDNLMGGNGDPADNDIVKTGPFRQGEWTIVTLLGNPAGPLIREFGVQVTTLASQTDVTNALSTMPYDASLWNTSSNPSFRNRLEGWYGATGPGLHNRGHVWVGGSMLPMTSPNDPVFFLNHCFVDKLWADWQTQNPGAGYLPTSGGPSGHNLNDPMETTVSGTFTPADMLDITALGYSYDTGAGTGTGTGTGTGGSRRCFIATAAYGSELQPSVQSLRDFRENILLHQKYRKWFIGIFNFYNKVSPPIAKAMNNNRLIKVTMKYLLVWPALVFVTVGENINKYFCRITRNIKP